MSVLSTYKPPNRNHTFNEKKPYKNSNSFLFRISILLLFPHLVYTCRMISPLKKMIVMIFWMSIAAGLVIGLDAIFEFPDEVSGVAYFICIGIAASGTLNYYK